MYAMMLPSGNDAAQSLAIYFGNLRQLLDAKGFVKGRNIAASIDANINEEEFPDEPLEEEEAETKED